MGSTSQEQLYDAFGAYVRSQRHLAQLTLRQVAELASISNPYLSQIEHGLALPSIAVIGALANALSVSAESLLLRAAGIVSPNTAGRARHSEDAIRHDPRLDDDQKHALLAVLASFVGSSSGAPADVPARARGARRNTSTSTPTTPISTSTSTSTSTPTTPISTSTSTSTSTSALPAAAGAASPRRKGHDHA